MSRRTAVSLAHATRAIAGVTWTRLWRGRGMWVTAALAALPLLIATFASGERGAWTVAFAASATLLMAVLPPMHLAAGLTEELEGRTSAYLWSRPIPRAAIITGKLAALVPMIIGVSALVILAVGNLLDPGPDAVAIPYGRAMVALAFGTLAASCLSVMIATIATKHAMSITISYLLFVDVPLGALPASLQNLSLNYHVRQLAAPASHKISGLFEADRIVHVPWAATSAITLVVIAALTLTVAGLRIRNLE